MKEREKVWALIPARAGSKGLPRKNLALVGEVSLLERAIRSAQDSGMVDHVIVSSDSQRILDDAVRCGASAHMRSPAAATDTSRANDVVSDFLASGSGASFSLSGLLVYLQPTSPFRTALHVRTAIQLSLREGQPCVSVKASSDLPSKAICIEEGIVVSASVVESDVTGNRQSVTSYHPNGAVYVFSKRQFLRAGDVPIVGARILLMDKLSSIDIDDEADLHIARGLISHGRV